MLFTQNIQNCRLSPVGPIGYFLKELYGRG